MAKKNTVETDCTLPDLNLSRLGIQTNDSASMKFMMLIEGVYGKGVRHAYGKYGYSEQRYHQLMSAFREKGFEALIDQKRGPKKNSKRSDTVVHQIIRLRFLDPDASAAVIAQKLRQSKFNISERSVERTIQEYGLQKKTISVKSKGLSKENISTSDKEKRKNNKRHSSK